MIGEVLDGHEILRPLGAGGMGEVYLARGEGGALRAFKIVRADQDLDAKAGRFRREVLTLGRLKHPNIIQIIDAGRTPAGALYLGMEYVAGPDLQTAINKNGPYPVADAIAILSQLASALAYAHEVGVVHRDLKPPNVILADGDPERVKIIDFGLAKIAADEGLTRLTEDQQVLGSPLYWAPEQSTNANVGPEADVYALGGIAYFVLSGAPIFSSRPGVALVYAHQYALPPPLAERCSDIEVPPALADLIAACIAKAPNERPTAAQVHAELEVLRAQVPTSDGQPRKKRLFSDSESNLAQALTSQMRQVLLDLASELELPTDEIERIQSELSEIELELAMVENDLETSVDGRHTVETQRDEIATRVAEKQAALHDAFRTLHAELSAHRGCSSTEATQLFEELDELDAQYQSA
ncbi:MAG: protein kinase [Myxococcota bacterium]|nr:protein kinase [Myxococcota bacterium]